MATGKRFYWIKLKDTFMTSDTIDYFMGLPEGANYVVLYQILLLKTANTDGRLSRQIGEVIIPYNAEKIQRDCKWFTIDTVRIALELYRRFGLIYEDQDGTLVMAAHNEMVGSETDYADKQRRYRISKDKELGGYIVSNDVSKNVSIDIDIDKDIDKKKYKRKRKTNFEQRTNDIGSDVMDKFDELMGDGSA